MTDGGKEQRVFSVETLSGYLSRLNMTRVVLWLIAITIVSFAIGCGILALTEGFPRSADHGVTLLRPSTNLTPSTTTIPLDGAKAGDVTILLGAGDLTLTGNAPDSALMEVTYFPQDPAWQPDLVLETNNSRISATLTDRGEHRKKESLINHHADTWEVSLNGKIPIRLAVNLGAGENTLMLGTLNLETLSVDTGAGDTVIDLGGYQGGRFDAAIANGVGDLTLSIPRGSNTRIRVDQGIGDITGPGFIESDHTYVMPGFSASREVNEITLDQGLGSITLIAV
ncbi:MAG TPA: toast rack family protein [Methanoregulaceae archaeon]|nr:toast rack family protein [Methanoregulaceae archaeon]HPD74469.1 toast rack family protein [Methanoregulaceae archaeon]HRY74741.1 toast rack family protein [Methanoregulaceae archaeon]